MQSPSHSLCYLLHLGSIATERASCSCWLRILGAETAGQPTPRVPLKLCKTIRQVVARSSLSLSDYARESTLNVTEVPRTFPEATATLTFSMNSLRSCGQKHGIKMLSAVAQLPLHWDSDPPSSQTLESDSNQWTWSGCSRVDKGHKGDVGFKQIGVGIHHVTQNLVSHFGVLRMIILVEL
jgi:hypothetical protein